MFSVIEFVNSRTISVVPETWLTGETKCYWPPLHTYKVSKLIQQMCPAKETWQKMDCKIKKCKILSYERALRYERLYEMENELECELESSPFSKRRRKSSKSFFKEEQLPFKSRRTDQFLLDSSESSDSTESTDEDYHGPSQGDIVDENILRENHRLSQLSQPIKATASTTDMEILETVPSRDDAAPPAKKEGQDILSELVIHRRILQSILAEHKKQTYYLRKLSREATDGPTAVKNYPEEMTLTSFDGQLIHTEDIPTNNPTKFALEILRKVKGPNYIKESICEPVLSCRTSKTPMDGDTIILLKNALSARFAKYSWRSVKDSINAASRDANRKSKGLQESSLVVH